MKRRAATLLALLAAPWLAAAAAADEAAPDLRFVVVGHLRGNHTGAISGIDELVSRIDALDPDLVFLTGDLIWGDYHDEWVDRAGIESDWERLDAAFAQLRASVHRVPGNHDVNDPVTRDVWLERYGALSDAFEFRGSRFVLLSSVPTPEGEGGPATMPRRFTRPRALPAGQLDVVRDALSGATDAAHVFVFLHHVLWWDEDAPWWRDVHPLLARAGVRAVFAGDYGPLKFSHVRRDGIDYLQSAVEGRVDPAVLRRIEKSRVLHYQLDNFLVVDVRGERVDVDVEVVGALSSGKYEPELWHEVYRREPLDLGERVDRALGGPARRAILASLLLASFAAGAVWARRRTRG